MFHQVECYRDEVTAHDCLSSNELTNHGEPRQPGENSITPYFFIFSSCQPSAQNNITKEKKSFGKLLKMTGRSMKTEMWLTRNKNGEDQIRVLLLAAETILLVLLGYALTNTKKHRIHAFSRKWRFLRP